MAEAKKTKTIVELLSEASEKIGAVEKKERNTVGSGFNFRGIDTVVNAVSPVFRELGIVVIPTTVDRAYEQLEVGKNRSIMGHAALRTVFTFYAPSGESVAATVDSEAMDSGDKAVAKAASVGLRTALLQVLMLPTDETDPDAETFERTQRNEKVETSPKSEPKAQVEASTERVVTEAQKTEINDLLEIAKENGRLDEVKALVVAASSDNRFSYGAVVFDMNDVQKAKMLETAREPKPKPAEEKAPTFAPDSFEDDIPF